MGDDPRLFAALFGVATYHLVRGELEIGQRLCEQCLQLAEKPPDPALLASACALLSLALRYQGEFVSARLPQERALALDRREYHEAYLSVFQEDVAISVRREVSGCLWVFGYPEQALAVAHEGVALAEQMSHPFSLGGAYRAAANISFYCRDWQTSLSANVKVMTLAEEYALGNFADYATIYDVLALAYQEPTPAALARAKQAIEFVCTKGVVLDMTPALAALAEVCGMAGHLAEGLEAMAEALALVERTGERYWEADIWRVKGELTLKAAADNSPVEAEACYHKAVEIARRQSAKSFELRAATSLARLWQRQGKPSEARQMLAGIYGWFTEGFDTADLQDAKALLDELGSEFKLQAVSIATEDKLKLELSTPSIAVLPFVNISNDPDNEYFCDGLAEELLNALSKIEALRVAARTSAFSFKGKETDIREIGRKLNVSTVLEGSVRKAGNRLRIAAQLVNIADGYHLWSERYDRQMEDIFDIQDEISLSIVDALKVKLLGAEKAAVLKRYTDNTEAYEIYLKGRYHYAKRTKDDIQKGIEYFRQAIGLDPNFALAYAMIAQSFSSMPVYPYLSPKEANPPAKAAAQRALEIDSALATAHVALAYSLATYDWNWAEAERAFKRAIEIDPNNDALHLRYAQVYLTPLGRHEEAIAELKRALELEPLSLFNNAMLTAGYLASRQFERALKQAEKTYDLEPSFVTGRYVLGLAYNVNGMYKEAIALSEESLQSDPTNQIYLRIAGYAYAKSGRQSEAEQVIGRFKAIAKTQYVISYAIASIYAALGDKDQAFTELERAFAERDWDLHRLNVDPLMDSLRDDPRFKDSVRRIGLPE